MATKTKICGFLVALTCALCVGLVSCGSPAEDYMPGFVGTWELSSLEGSEEGMSADDFAILKERGMVASLDLKDDGTCSFDLFGDVREGTWEAPAADAARITVADQVSDVALAGDTLTITQNTGQSLIFTKASAASSAAASSERAEDAASASGEDGEDSEAAEAAEAPEDTEDANGTDESE